MTSTDQRIEPLNRAELAWVRDELANARKLAALHCDGNVADVLTPEILDQSYAAAYRAAPPADANYANAVVNAIGIAFGQYLVDNRQAGIAPRNTQHKPVQTTAQLKMELAAQQRLITA